MKSLIALVALSLAALALVPSASAHVAPPRPEFPLCEPVAPLGSACVSPVYPGCNVWIEWTAIPAQPTCLYRTDGLAASAAGPDVQCMDVYTRYDVGTVSVVRRDSCAPPEVYDCPYEGAPISSCDPLLELTAAASTASAGPGAQCMDVYSETHLVGPYWLVRRDSCSAQVYECPEGSSPPAPPCKEVQLLSASAAAAPPVGVPPIYCMPYEREVDLGDVQVVQGGCGNYVRVCGDRVTLAWDGDVSCVTDDLVTMDCYAIYREVPVGPVSIVMTSSCSGHAELCGDRVSPFASPDLSCVAATTSAAEPECLQVYREHDLGPVRYVSKDSCHSDVYVCGDNVKQAGSTDPAAYLDCLQ